MGRFASVLLFLLPVACGAPAPPAAGGALPVVPASGAQRYMPLQPGHVWAYETWVESSGARGVAAMEVLRRDPQVAVLSIAGRLQYYETPADGIRHVDGGYLLREPLVVGATWRGRTGTVTVLRVDRAVTVPAGSYQGCVETREEASAAKRITTTFCPGVGIVEFEVTGGAGAELDVVQYRLRSYGPKVVLEAPASGAP